MKFYDIDKFRLRKENIPAIEMQFNPLWFIVDFGKGNGKSNHEYNELNRRLSAIYEQVRLALPTSMSRILDEIGWIKTEQQQRLISSAYELGFVRGCNSMRPGIRRKTYN